MHQPIPRFLRAGTVPGTFDQAAGRGPAPIRRGWRERLAGFDWTPDLGHAIGSARWWRGLASLIALIALAYQLAPDWRTLPDYPDQKIDSPAQQELRALAVAPLARGGASGRQSGIGARVVPIAAAPERAMIRVMLTVGAGDSLARVLERAGVGPADAARAASAVGQHLRPGEPAPGTRIDVMLGKRAPGAAQRSLDALAFRARFDLDVSLTRTATGFAVNARPLAIDATPLRIRGTIGTGIYRSARAAGAPVEAIQQYLQVIDQHLSLDTDIAAGDTFDLIVANRRSVGGGNQVGDLLYAGIERAGQPRAQLLRWGSDGQFFEASGMGAQRTGLLMPVVGRITSGFGARRHPILGYTRMHGGVDFGAAWGSPIYAVGDATVSFAGWHGGHGNFVRLEHGSGFGTGYAHMSRIAVSPGARVRAGQVIGYVGSTGLSTGPHLHYELYRNGEKVNPLSVRFTVSNQVDAQELAAFRARLAQLKAVKSGAIAN